MKVFLDMIPPKVTAQEKKVRIINGRPVFYMPSRLKKAKEDLTILLRLQRPRERLTGPLELKTVWAFPKGKAHRDQEWRVSRPDTDNLQKMLKDCMTEAGYWIDDSQVVKEEIQKIWAEKEGITISINQLRKHKEN